MRTIREMFLGLCRDKDNVKHIYDQKTLTTFCNISLDAEMEWIVTKIEWEYKGRKMSARVLCPECVNRFKEIEKEINPEGESQFYDESHYKRALPIVRKAEEPPLMP